MWRRLYAATGEVNPPLGRGLISKKFLVKSFVAMGGLELGLLPAFCTESGIFYDILSCLSLNS
jgi:hypothetical protein